MKNKIAGLYLWEVKVNYDYLTARSCEYLWITTSVNSLAAAEGKASKFLLRKPSNYPHAEIKAITSHGTIDA